MIKVRAATIAVTVTTSVLIGGAAWAAYTWTHTTPVPIRIPEAAEPVVTVLGDVDGLTPGHTKKLRVKIENDNEFPVKITKIAGGTAATASGCAAWAVRVTPTTASAYAVTIPGRASTTVTVKVGMEEWADQKCAGQTLSLDLTTYMAGA
jgi:hypothetical protein